MSPRNRYYTDCRRSLKQPVHYSISYEPNAYLPGTQ